MEERDPGCSEAEVPSPPWVSVFRVLNRGASLACIRAKLQAAWNTPTPHQAPTALPQPCPSHCTFSSGTAEPQLSRHALPSPLTLGPSHMRFAQLGKLPLSLPAALHWPSLTLSHPWMSLWQPTLIASCWGLHLCIPRAPRQHMPLCLRDVAVPEGKDLVSVVPLAST